MTNHDTTIHSDDHVPDVFHRPLCFIAFAKYDVFEEFWGRNATATDYETLRQAATVAEAKIT